MSKGWISIHRKFTRHWLYCQKPYDKCHAWLDILLSVNHQDGKVLFDGRLIPVNAGQMLTSLSELSEKWGWGSRSKTRRFLELLVSDGMVDLKRNTNGTLLTVANWAKYQSRETQTEHSRNTGETLTDTNNNDNNVYKGDGGGDAREGGGLGKVVTAYCGTICSAMPSPTIVEDVKGFLGTMDPEVIIDAFSRAAAENKRSWSYIRGILRNREQRGVRTMSDVAREDLEHEQRAPGRKRGGKPGGGNIYAELADKHRGEGVAAVDDIGS